MWEEFVRSGPDLDSITTALTMVPCYVVKVEGDPLELNRYRCCVPTLYGEGEQNWTNWVHKAGFSNSSASYNGDVGVHWPSTPGEMGLYAFQQLNPVKGFYIPLGTVSEEPKAEKSTIIKEVKSANKKNEGHMHYYMKTPSGHTLAFTDKVGDEGVAVMHASGQGLFISGGFKGSNPSQSEKQETKVRTADVRGDKSVVTQTADSPSKVFKEGQGTVMLLGQNGSGINVVDTKSGGTVLISTHKASGSSDGPSIYMSTEEGGLILLTAAGAQLQIRGAKGDIKVTKQVIQEAVKEDVEGKFTSKLKSYAQSFWKRAFNIQTASNSGGSTPSSSSSPTSNTNMGNISPAPVTTTGSGGLTNVSGV